MLIMLKGRLCNFSWNTKRDNKGKLSIKATFPLVTYLNKDDSGPLLLRRRVLSIKITAIAQSWQNNSKTVTPVVLAFSDKLKKILNSYWFSININHLHEINTYIFLLCSDFMHSEDFWKPSRIILFWEVTWEELRIVKM